MLIQQLTRGHECKCANGTDATPDHLDKIATA